MTTAAVAPIPLHTTSEPSAASETVDYVPRDRLSRLICGRSYLLGVVSTLATLHREWRPVLLSHQRPVGYDRRVVVFHTLQSLLLSALFLIPCGAIYYLAPLYSPAALTAALAIVGVKIAIVNPWLSRGYFGRETGRELLLPGVWLLADWGTRHLVPLSEKAVTAVYFKSHRPFVGFGQELNSWAVAIDTSAQPTGWAPNLHPKGPEPLAARELYTAVATHAESLGAGGVTTYEMAFIPGQLQRRPRLRQILKFERPRPQLPDQESTPANAAEAGREYLVLQSRNATRDLVVSMLVRFSQVGKCVFCEFASHVIPPGLSRFDALERIYGWAPVVYALVGPLLFALAALAATLSSPLLENLIRLPLSVYLPNLADLVLVPPNYRDWAYMQLSGGWFAYRIIGTVLVLLVLFAAWRVLLSVGIVIGVVTGLKQNVGSGVTYRERCAKGTNLAYFDVQDVIGFLKVQERVLTAAIVGVLQRKGIDASDFKENVASFVNQGIINSGDIQGNVAMRLRSMVFRGRSKRRVGGGPSGTKQ